MGFDLRAVENLVKAQTPRANLASPTVGPPSQIPTGTPLGIQKLPGPQAAAFPLPTPQQSIVDVRQSIALARAQVQAAQAQQAQVQLNNKPRPRLLKPNVHTCNNQGIKVPREMCNKDKS